MYIDQVKDYMDERPNLTKIEITTELVPDVSVFVVTKTKETYVFEDEQSADEKVDMVRQNPNFISVEKKYKAGKLDKAGEVVKPETWTVIAKLAHH